MPTITITDGTQIYYKDSGSGRPIVFSHGWPPRSDVWDALASCRSLTQAAKPKVPAGA